MIIMIEETHTLWYPFSLPFKGIQELLSCFHIIFELISIILDVYFLFSDLEGLRIWNGF